MFIRYGNGSNAGGTAEGRRLGVGQTCTARCADGYAPREGRGQGGLHLGCNAGNMLTSVPATAGTTPSWKCVNVTCSALSCWELQSRQRPRLIGICPDCEYSCGVNGTGCQVGCRDGYSEVPINATVAGVCRADGAGTISPAYTRAHVTCVAATCPVPPLDVGQTVLSGCVAGGVMGQDTCSVGCADGYFVSSPVRVSLYFVAFPKSKPTLR